MNEEYYNYVKNQASLLGLTLEQYLNSFAPQYKQMVLTSAYYLNDFSNVNFNQKLLISSATWAYDNTVKRKIYTPEIVPENSWINNYSSQHDVDKPKENLKKEVHISTDYVPYIDKVKTESPKEPEFEFESLTVKKTKL
jgi:hypothetical protein